MLCGVIFDAPAKQKLFDKLEQQMAEGDFWNDKENSQKVLQERKRLEQSLNQERAVASTASDIDTLFSLAREGEDVVADIGEEMKKFQEKLTQLENNMLLAGENDHRAAIITIHPGAGGTESQDWAEMLERTYLRWSERKGFPTVITDRLDGEGAGIKSVTFEVNGEYAFGVALERNRRTPAGPNFAFRFCGTAAHVVRQRLRLSANRRRRKDRCQTRRLARRRIPRIRRWRPTRQSYRVRRSHDPPSYRPCGAMPERAFAD